MASEDSPHLPLGASLAAWLLAGCQTLPGTAGHPPQAHETYAEVAHAEFQQGDRPAWVDELPHQPGVVYGVGSGRLYGGDQAAAMRAAMEHARVEVAKAVERINIEAVTELQQHRMRALGRTTKLTRSLRASVRTHLPRTEIQGLEMVTTYVDRPQQTVYALAQLNRQLTAAKLSQQMAALDAKLERFSQVPTHLPRAEQLSRLLPALPLLAERNRLLEQQLRISEQPRLAPAPFEAALNRRIDNLLQHLVVALQPQGTDAQQMTPRLLKHLTDKGIRVGARGRPDLTLSYHLNTRAAQRGDRYFVLAEGLVVVKDGQGVEVNALDARTKGVSGVSEGLAYDKAVAQLGDELGNALRDGLLKQAKR